MKIIVLCCECNGEIGQLGDDKKFQEACEQHARGDSKETWQKKRQET
jgi:hypothetical protein